MFVLFSPSCRGYELPSWQRGPGPVVVMGNGLTVALRLPRLGSFRSTPRRLSLNWSNMRAPLDGYVQAWIRLNFAS